MKRGNRGTSTAAESERVLGGNGHGAGLLRQGAVEALFKDTEMPSVAKELVHPGKEPIELMMRCYFDDEREVNAAVLYLSKCEEFKDEEGKRILLWKMAGKTSIKGRSRQDLLQAVTGILLRDIGPQKSKKEEKGDEK